MSEHGTGLSGGAGRRGAGVASRRAVLTACLIAASLLSACKSGPEVFVPLQKTAIDQFQYAINYRDRHALTLRNSSRPEQQKATREAVRQIFEKVVEYFPEDREVTPLAKLELADMQAGLDLSETPATDREIRRAAEKFYEIREDYPELDFVQAKAALDEGRCRLKLKEYEEAQALFNEITTAWADSNDQEIRRIVVYARTFYDRAYVR